MANHALTFTKSRLERTFSCIVVALYHYPKRKMSSAMSFNAFRVDVALKKPPMVLSNDLNKSSANEDTVVQLLMLANSNKEEIPTRITEINRLSTGYASHSLMTEQTGSSSMLYTSQALT